jgi:DNA-binding transcriptional ArsR family regulator
MNETEKDKQTKDRIDPSTVSLKVQKLSSALYLVSSFLPDEDPLKWSLRKEALEALRETKLAVQSMTREGICLFDRAISSMGRLIDLIQVALIVPGVSQMNFSILQTEYTHVRDEMSQTPSPFLSLALPPAPAAGISVSQASSPLTFKKTGVRAVIYPQNSAPNPRKELIVKYLKSNGWSSIKDIAQRLPEVSSKTVQRELADLVQLGVIKREGDRRWSRYALVDSAL